MVTVYYGPVTCQVPLAGYNVETMTAGSAAGAMRLVGGDPCLDFVNTVGGRTGGRRAAVRGDKLSAYSDLVAWSRHADLTRPAEGRALLRLAHVRPREAARVLARAERLRESLYRVLRSLMDGGRPLAADLDAVSLELSAARVQDRLTVGPDGVRWQAPETGEHLESVLWPVARAASALLTSGDLSRLRQCGGDQCGWLFLDRSRNHSRQWCTMEDCGNVSKVRRFRQRRRRTRRDEEDGT
jgi:predicted RNA-binding Zn ribbon-like protein